MENPPPHIRNKVILVVDDEPIIQKICAMVLGKQGFSLILAADGMDGLNTYRERHREICLVISDITMPLMNGIEMTRKMFEVYPHANVILMSGANLCDLVPEELKKLCSVMPKPFTPAQLLEAVGKCLKYDEAHKADTVSA